MSLFNNLPVILAALILLTTGCAGPWLTKPQEVSELSVGEQRGLHRSRDLPTRQLASRNADYPPAGSRSSAANSLNDVRRQNPGQPGALKQQLAETSADLPPMQQRLLPHLAATLSRHADITPAPHPPELSTSRERAHSASESSPSRLIRITDSERPKQTAAAGPPLTSERSVRQVSYEQPAATPAPAPAPATLLETRGATILESAETADTASQGEDASSETVASDDADEPPFRAGQWKTSCAAAIEQLEKELLWGEIDDAEQAQLEASLRLLYLIANRREKAVEPITTLSDDEREFWKHQLFGLSVSLDLNRHAPPRRAALALREIRAAAGHLANISALDVRNLAFCKSVESFGRYVEFKPYSFDAGQEVLLYVEVENFAAEAVNDEYQTELKGEYTIINAAGARVVSRVLPADAQTCSNRRRDYFIAYRLFLPTEISTGEYTLTLTMEDAKGQKSNQGSIEFRVR